MRQLLRNHQFIFHRILNADFFLNANQNGKGTVWGPNTEFYPECDWDMTEVSGSSKESLHGYLEEYLWRERNDRDSQPLSSLESTRKIKKISLNLLYFLSHLLHYCILIGLFEYDVRVDHVTSCKRIGRQAWSSKPFPYRQIICTPRCRALAFKFLDPRSWLTCKQWNFVKFFKLVV